MDGGVAATDKLAGIHALRTVAAVTVFFYHVLAITASSAPGIAAFGHQLTYGVPLFFAVSAFSLMYSTRPYQGQTGWVLRFYLKRYFRIAPLFYVMMIFHVGLYSSMALHPMFPQLPWPGWDKIVLNLTFTFGLSPLDTSSLVMTGWSVGVEMLFYLVFPLFLVLIRNIRDALVFVVLSHITGELARPILDPLAPVIFTVTLSDQHFLTNLRYFAFGILAFHIYNKFGNTAVSAGPSAQRAAIFGHMTFAGLSLILIYLLAAFRPWLISTYHLDMVAWGLLFTVLCVWVTLRPIRFLSWTPFQYLGERSYSLYLLHFPIMLLLVPSAFWVFETLRPAFGDAALILAVVLVYIPVVLLSALTYLLVEKPGMNLGRKVIRATMGAAVDGGSPQIAGKINVKAD